MVGQAQKTSTLCDDNSAGLYVHVPFCATQCGYCDFYSEAPRRVDEYVDAVVAEARRKSVNFDVFSTLYLGGGTPSLLPLSALDRLVQGIRQSCELLPGAERTLEANPDDLTAGRCAAWRELGFGRLSLGVQAFDDRLLALLGRRHDLAGAAAAFAGARAEGFDNIGLDLIWGLPGQSEAQWVEALRRAADLGPEHLSCYQLTLEPHVPLAREALSLPGEDTARRLFEATVSTLDELGYQQYEVSNYSKTKAFRSRHNSLYWDHTPYLGLGPSAHSFDGQRRFWNRAEIDGYIEAVKRGDDPAAGSERLSDEQRLLEELMLGFRTTRGVAFETLTGRFAHGAQIVDALLDEGLVTLEDPRRLVEINALRVKPTLSGLALSDSLPLRFY